MLGSSRAGSPRFVLELSVWLLSGLGCSWLWISPPVKPFVAVPGAVTSLPVQIRALGVYGRPVRAIPAVASPIKLHRGLVVLSDPAGESWNASGGKGL